MWLLWLLLRLIIQYKTDTFCSKGAVCADVQVELQHNLFCNEKGHVACFTCPLKLFNQKSGIRLS